MSNNCFQIGVTLLETFKKPWFLLTSHKFLIWNQLSRQTPSFKQPVLISKNKTGCDVIRNYFSFSTFYSMFRYGHYQSRAWIRWVQKKVRYDSDQNLDAVHRDRQISIIAPSLNFSLNFAPDQRTRAKRVSPIASIESRRFASFLFPSLSFENFTCEFENLRRSIRNHVQVKIQAKRPNVLGYICIYANYISPYF